MINSMLETVVAILNDCLSNMTQSISAHWDKDIKQTNVGKFYKPFPITNKSWNLLYEKKLFYIIRIGVKYLTQAHFNFENTQIWLP